MSGGQQVCPWSADPECENADWGVQRVLSAPVGVRGAQTQTGFLVSFLDPDTRRSPDLDQR